MTLVLALSVPLLLVLITYLLQERGKRRAELLEHRQSLYESLIRSLVELLGAPTAEERSRLITKIETSWLFASDPVLDAAYRYVAVYDELCCSLMREGNLQPSAVLIQVRSDPETRTKLRDHLADVFAEMRRDIRDDTFVTNQWAREHLDIYCWGILSGAETTARDGDWDATRTSRSAGEVTPGLGFRG
ncbi:MAG TPA: hypothetical protein VFM51_08955 [Solirubrobacterales bacterium]|nr:hypothetical protein [Solirubrobacterales bacterium]